MILIWMFAPTAAYLRTVARAWLASRLTVGEKAVSVIGTSPSLARTSLVAVETLSRSPGVRSISPDAAPATAGVPTTNAVTPTTAATRCAITRRSEPARRRPRLYTAIESAAAASTRKYATSSPGSTPSSIGLSRSSGLNWSTLPRRFSGRNEMSRSTSRTTKDRKAAPTEVFIRDEIASDTPLNIAESSSRPIQPPSDRANSGSAIASRRT